MANNPANSPFWGRLAHRHILILALPMILSNITTPLIGMVDTAVLGHMQNSQFLAGAAIASLILTQTYWLCGFIRMSSTGLSAQAKGRQDSAQASKVLWHSVSIALSIGLFIWFMQQPLLGLGLYFSAAGTALQDIISQYFSVRIYGAPAALANLAIIGWLIGQQQTRQVLIIQLLANLLNAALSIFMVFVLGWGVKGVALASVLAEYSIFVSGMWLAVRLAGDIRPKLADWHWTELAKLMSLNGHSFIRNLALQLCLAFVIFQGARYGQMTAASNAIVMQFFALIALGLDGIAYAIEALVGEAKGRASNQQVYTVVLQGLFWSAIMAGLYSLAFVFFGRQIIGLLTDLPELIAFSYAYIPIICLLPVVSHWCFLLDGVFVGLTRAKAMQNSMLLSSLLVFFPSWWLLRDLENMALWIALLIFMLARGASLGWYFTFLYQRGRLVA